MSNGFDAQTRALTAAAKGIDDLLDAMTELGGKYAAGQGRGLDGLRMDPDDVGNTGVAEALGGFVERWQWGIRTLVQQGRTIAQKLHETGIAYQHSDTTAGGLLRRAAEDLGGNPHADPATAQDKSWSEVMRDTNGRILHPDYSSESFHHLSEEAGKTWDAEAKDVANHYLQQGHRE